MSHSVCFAWVAAFLHLLAMGTANAQTGSKAGASPQSFPDFRSAGGATSNLSTLIAAVQAAGVAGTLNGSTAWTILAPTNQAFETRLKKDLNMTPAALLDPANKATLAKVLSYHVIPTGAISSSSLTNGQSLTTALAGAAPLRVHFVGATNSATVVVSDVKVGKSVVHVVNDVLLPEDIGKGKGKNARP